MGPISSSEDISLAEVGAVIALSLAARDIVGSTFLNWAPIPTVAGVCGTRGEREAFNLLKTYGN